MVAGFQDDLDSEDETPAPAAPAKQIVTSYDVELSSEEEENTPTKKTPVIKMPSSELSSSEDEQDSQTQVSQIDSKSSIKSSSTWPSHLSDTPRHNPSVHPVSSTVNSDPVPLDCGDTSDMKISSLESADISSKHGDNLLSEMKTHDASVLVTRDSDSEDDETVANGNVVVLQDEDISEEETPSSGGLADISDTKQGQVCCCYGNNLLCDQSEFVTFLTFSAEVKVLKDFQLVIMLILGLSRQRNNIDTR